MIRKFGAVILASLMLTGLWGCGTGTSPSISQSEKNSTASTSKKETEEKKNTSASVSKEESTEITAVLGDKQEGLDVDRSRVFDIFANINVGWNIGNTLDATGGGNTVNAETSWGNPKVTQELIDGVADKGFNAIRIPVTFANHLGPAPDYTIREDWLNRVKEVVDYCVNRDLYIVLDTHHETDSWLKVDPDNQDALCAELAAIWTQIAETFKDYDEKLMFEGMNEPRMKGSSKEWSGGTVKEQVVINAMNEAFVNAVRATGGNNSDRILIICSYGHCPDNLPLKNLNVPADPNVAVAVHMYDPYLFTYVASGDYSTWNGSKKGDISGRFKSVKTNLIDKGIPVIITETGAQFKDNTDDIVRWIGDYMGIMDEYNVKCFVWDNNIYKGQGEKFGLYNRLKKEWYNETIADAYVNHGK